MPRRGTYAKRRTATKTSRSSRFGSTRRSAGKARRSTGGARRATAQPVIRIELIQGGPAPLANPALPIPPSVRTPKSSKAKL